MAEPLGISGYVDIEDIKKSFENLDALLGKLGIDFSKTSKAATTALQNIADAADKNAAQKVQEVVSVIKKAREEAEKAVKSIDLSNASDEIKRIKSELESVNSILEQNASSSLTLANRIEAQQKIVAGSQALLGQSGGKPDPTRLAIYEDERNKLARLVEEQERLQISTDQLIGDQEALTKELQKQVEKEGELTRAKELAEEETKRLAEEEKKRQQEFNKINTPQKHYNVLRQEITQLITEYNNLTEAERQSAKGEDLLDRIDQKRQEAAELKRVLDDTTKQLKSYSDNQLGLHAIAEGANLASSALGTLEGAVRMLGISEKDYQEVQTAIQTSLAANNLLTQASSALRKESALMTSIAVVQEWALQKATDADTAAKSRNTAATVLLTAKQRIFNLVAKANPYVLLATAMVTVVGAVWLAVKAFNAHNKAVEEAKRKEEELKQTNEDFAKSVASGASESLFKYKQLQSEWAKLGDDMTKRNKFVEANKKTFNELGFSITSVKDAERLLVDNTDAVVNSIMARAKASAYASIMQKKQEELIQKQIENETSLGGKYKAGDKITSISGMNISDYKVNDREIDYIDYTGTGKLTSQKIREYLLTEEGATRLNEEAVRKANDELASEYDKFIDKLRTGQEEATRELVASEAELVGLLTANGSDGEKEKLAEALRKRQKLQRDLEEIEKQSQQTDISLMSDGLQKRLAQIDFNYEEEKKTIQKKRREISEEQGRPLNADGNALFDRREELLRQQYEKEKRTEIEAERKKIEEEKKLREDAMDDYLIEYGTYEEKREAIARQTARKIAEARTEGEKMMLSKQGEESLRQLDFEKLKEDIDWEAIFGDLKNVPVEVLDDVNDKLKKFKEEVKDLNPEDMKTLIEAMNSIESRVNVTSGFNGIREAVANRRAAQTNFNEAVKVYNYAKNDPEAEAWIVEEAYKRMIKAGKELSNAKKKEDDVWEDSIETATNYAKAISEVGKAIGGATGECLELAASAVMAGIGMADGIKAFGKAASAMERSVAVLAIIQAALQAVQAITSLFGGKEDTTLKSYVSAMDNYLNMLKSDIDKLKQAMDDSKNSMAETIQLYKDYLELQKQNSQAIKNQSRIWLNSGASGSSHSEGYKIADDIRDGLKSKSAQVKSFFQGAYNDLKTFYYQATHTVLSSTDQLGRMEWIWNLSDDTLKQLSQNYNVMSILGDKLSGAILSYVESLETVADSEDELFANLLDVDFDGFYSDFEEMISDMEVTSEEFADDFGEQLRKSLIKNMVAKNYKLSLEDLYKKAAEYAREGTLENNISDLKEEYQRLADNAREEVEAINKITGFKSATSNDKSATYNSLEKFTYDQADDLIARVTAIQIIGEHQNDKLASMAEGQNIIVEEVRLVGGNVKNIDSNVTALLDIQQQSLGQLERINRNTSVLPTMADDMVKIKKMIENQ